MVNSRSPFVSAVAAHSFSPPNRRQKFLPSQDQVEQSDVLCLFSLLTQCSERCASARRCRVGVTPTSGTGQSYFRSSHEPLAGRPSLSELHRLSSRPKETLATYPVTTFCGTPTIFRMLLQHEVSSYHFRSLKFCLSGGEPMNPEMMEHWKAQTGLEIQEGYGQTETTMLCGTLTGMQVKPGFMGKPCPPFDVQVINEHGDRLPPGEEGDIAVRIRPKRPLGLFTSYVDDPEKTASTIRGDFYITGDRGVTDKDGYIQFIARADDVILSSGYRIGPFEVENALAEHPAVADSAAVSSPDPIRGEVVKAFIVLSPAYQSHDREKLILELQEHVKKVTAPYKYPRKIEFVQQLPKTISGKTQRKLLRKKEWGEA